MNDKLREALELLNKINTMPLSDDDFGRIVQARVRLNEALAASKQEPQAQAKKPIILESAAEARADREHAEKYCRQAERLLTANERTRHEAIAKKDAALRACVEAGKAVADADDSGELTTELVNNLRSSITQAEEAMR